MRRARDDAHTVDLGRDETRCGDRRLSTCFNVHVREAVYPTIDLVF